MPVPETSAGVCTFSAGCPTCREASTVMQTKQLLHQHKALHGQWPVSLACGFHAAGPAAHVSCTLLMQAANSRLASVQQRAHQLEMDFAEVEQRVQELDAACQSKQQQLEVITQQAARAQEAAAKAEAEVCATLKLGSQSHFTS